MGASGSDLRSRLLRERYLLKNEHGDVVETPEQMFRRVAKAIAAPEEQYGTSASDMDVVAGAFFRLMSRGLFLPNSPTLMNAGCRSGLLSACFVLGIEDSVDGIFDAVKRTALIQKAGGGTGFALDTLRPTGDRVASTGGVTSGPLSFWRVFAETMTAIQQGAMRRGAGMAMMAIDHPDILSFIAAKQSPGAFANFNISVEVPDAFLQALAEDPQRPHVVTNPRDLRQYLLPQSLPAGRYGIHDLVPAQEPHGPCLTVRDVWSRLVTNAHAAGEPGVCFIDRVNATNPTPHVGRIHAMNPCGEQPLLAGEACCLGSIDVSKFVLADGTHFDWPSLGEVVRLAVGFLDNVIDASVYPLADIEAVTKGNRKIGLGIMGFADALVKMGVRYDSDAAVEHARTLGGFLQKTAHAASQQLAERRGCFPNWEGSVWDTDHGRPMRNASCTTIAPTGSLSILAGCSAGIEPVYNLAYVRRALDGREFVLLHPFLERLGRRDGWLTDTVRAALHEGVPPARVQGFPARLAELLVTAHDVAPEWHVRLQAAFQEHVDSAVSKTVNLPSEATAADVDRVYRLAHELDCKGTTVYRDGCREGQTFSAASRRGAPGTTPALRPRPRGRVTKGRTFKFRMGCGTLFVTVNRDDHGLCEVFANLGTAGGCPSQSEATCRAVSIALRAGVDPRELVDQLRRIRCLSTAAARNRDQGVDVLSCPDAIARAIEEAMSETSRLAPKRGQNVCPDCGAQLRKEEGCLVCTCGYSKCT